MQLFVLFIPQAAGNVVSRDIRAFIAAEIPASPALRRLSRELSDVAEGIRLSSVDTLHLTLKFLGDITYEEIPDVVRAMELAAGRHEPIAGEIVGVGTFPTIARPRVVWAGLVPREPIQKLAYDLEGELESLRFPRENKEFKPHVTLGRFKRNHAQPALAEWQRERTETVLGEFVLDELILFQSELMKGGPQYTPLATVSL